MQAALDNWAEMNQSAAQVRAAHAEFLEGAKQFKVEKMSDIVSESSE